MENEMVRDLIIILKKFYDLKENTCMGQNTEKEKYTISMVH